VENGKHPRKVEKELKLNSQIQVIADEFKNARNYFLGRATIFPSLEGALKLKEIRTSCGKLSCRRDEARPSP